jgi:murein DD-endopeptidase MepM/ murein hydrolase activator NlpD
VWNHKILILLLAIEASGCFVCENPKREMLVKKESELFEQATVEVIHSMTSTPEKELVIQGTATTTHRQSSSIFENIIPATATRLNNSGKLCSPLASVPIESLSSVVSDPYNPPTKGKDDRHQGVDFAYYRRFNRMSIAGEVVQSVFMGRVAGIIEDKFPYGNAVIIETPYRVLSAEIQQLIGIEAPQSLYTLYGHLESISVQIISSDVNPCQSIGVVGKTGNAGVEHLHLEMRVGPPNQIFPSMGYYVPDVTPAERATYVRWRTSGEFVHFDPMKLLDINP